MRADEALRSLEVFIDNAIIRNLPFVSIIHGKGTGALREVTHQFLERQGNLRCFRLGTIPEGGDGVTIVEL
jgi:DNA mismatch repair protein MutS2